VARDATVVVIQTTRIGGAAQVPVPLAITGAVAIAITAVDRIRIAIPGTAIGVRAAARIIARIGGPLTGILVPVTIGATVADMTQACRAADMAPRAVMGPAAAVT